MHVNEMEPQLKVIHRCLADRIRDEDGLLQELHSAFSGSVLGTESFVQDPASCAFLLTANPLTNGSTG